MQTQLTNRQAPEPKRGRPTNAEIAARAPVVASEPVPVHVTGCRCPCCGRAMIPKILRGNMESGDCRCTLCGGVFRRFQSAGIWVARPK